MGHTSLGRWLAPAPHRERLSEEEIRRRYPAWRLTILSASFVGYSLFYLVRNNLSIVSKDLGAAMAYDKSMIGDMLAVTALTYGVGKFALGAVSDRSDPRKFMALGLVLTALCNFAFGASTTYRTHLLLWGLNGFVQGMGWGPCGRSLGHWFSVRERGTMFALWNISHNVGGGLAGIVAAWSATRWGWESAFYIPGLIALLGAMVMYVSLRDTPQSVGLPPIEEWRDDYPAASSGVDRERELSFREIFARHILGNRLLWLVAAANFFVYVARYSMLDWGPMYLREMKGATLLNGGQAIALIEFGGIPSTILVGWFSDRLGGRRGMVSLLCMIPVLLAFVGMILNPPGALAIDMALLATVGFFVYPPVMLLGVAALDLTSKKAVGAAAGFVGLFGYLGRTVQATLFGWFAAYGARIGNPEFGWHCVLWSIVGACAASMVLLAFTWNMRPRA